MADKKKHQRCYIYTRVSTQMQVDGYSLDAQKNRLLKEAAHRGMEVASEFSDEGKSGKNVTGRPQFLEMIRRIQDGNKDGVSYVYVFKLSRFGRNAADVLNFMQLLRDYNVSLLCVEDGLDSSTATGRIMFAVLAAVAEMERENIQAQSAAGMEQKAREGLWNGGQAPYGYRSDGSGEGRLLIDEDEAPIVRLIYDKYVRTDMGCSSVAKWLNENGYRRKPRQNGRHSVFTFDAVKSILENPVYTGKIVYGRFALEKVEGKRGETRAVKHDQYQLFDGQHEAIVAQDLWDAAQAKRKKTAGQHLQHHGPKNVHVLSGLVTCPGCGSPMYGKVHRRKRKCSPGYTEIPYYLCKNIQGITGRDCSFNRRIRQEILDSQVYEVVRQAIENTSFMDDLAEAIGKPEDLDRLSAELEAVQRAKAAAERKKSRLLDKIMELDPEDSQYDAMYGDLQGLLRKQNEEIAELGDKAEDAAARAANAKEAEMAPEKIMAACRVVMGKLGDSSLEAARDLMHMFVEAVEIYPEPLPSGQIVKRVKFRFPVTLDGVTVGDVFDYDEDNELPDGGPPDDSSPGGGSPSGSNPSPDGSAAPDREGKPPAPGGTPPTDGVNQHADECTPISETSSLVTESIFLMYAVPSLVSRNPQFSKRSLPYA